jgi:ribosomal-protein-alanine acetyltransferase
VAFLLIRAAVIGDVACIMELERQCATAAHWSIDQYRAALDGGSLESRRLVFVSCSLAEQNDSLPPTECSGLIGFLVARVVGAEWEVENVVVAPGVRRKGVGSRLLGECLTRALEAHAEAIFLEVRESNHAARALYEKAGFAPVGRRKGYYSEPPADAIVYRLTWPSDLRS